MSKIALVVGGTGGLRAACAEDLVKDYTVIVSGRNKDKGAVIVEKQGGLPAADIMDPASIHSFHQTVADEYGRLDVALNAAGVLPAFEKLADTSKDTFDRCMTVNITGTYLAMQEQVRLMQGNTDKAGGVIVNFTSVFGLTVCKWGSIYSATKHAIVGLTRSASVEYAMDNIRISAVAPGIIPMEMTTGLDPTALPEGELKTDAMEMIKAYPQRRFGEVTDCSRAVRYLVDSPWSTGMILEINGGFGAKR